MSINFCALWRIQLVSMSVLMSVPHCFDYYSFVLSFEIWNCESSNFVLFQNCLYYWGFPVFLFFCFFKINFFFFNIYLFIWLHRVLFIYLFLYLFLAVLDLRFCVRAFSSCGKQGPLFIAVRGPLTIVASLVAKHRLQTLRLSSCGSRAQLLRGM